MTFHPAVIDGGARGVKGGGLTEATRAVGSGDECSSILGHIRCRLWNRRSIAFATCRERLDNGHRIVASSNLDLVVGNDRSGYSLHLGD